MQEFLSITTALTLCAIWVVNVLLSSDAGAFAVTPNQQRPLPLSASTAYGASLPASVMAGGSEPLSARGLLGFGMGFGAMLALVRAAVARRAEKEGALVYNQGTRTALAKDPENLKEFLDKEGLQTGVNVREKFEMAPVAYLENIPRTIVERDTLEAMLMATPREEWEDPSEDSPLYILKAYAETYGPGKATKMGWWDYFQMKVRMPGADEVDSENYRASLSADATMLLKGQVPFAVPTISGWTYTGAVIQFKGKEPFAGDLVQTPLTHGRFGKQFIQQTAFYREGLKPWQRGLEIGMAHGYFLIGPFVILGPLRNTPEAATVGLLCGAAVVGIVTSGAYLFNTILAPTLFDEEGETKPGRGFAELINWHAVGGFGGAGFAHALLTVFGGY